MGLKALVLSGGAGTRLRPLTHTSAKQLVPVANKPILFYGLEAIADAGITEVGIVVGDTEAEIRVAVGDGSAFGLAVTYIRQSAPLGLSHAVLISREYLGDDDFVLFLGDNFILGGITEAVERFRVERPAAQIMLTPVPDPRAFGVAELDDEGRLVRLEEKPAHPRSNLALVGVFLFTPAVHDAVRAIRPSARGELEISAALQWMLDSGLAVKSTIISGYWKDTGTADDILEVNRLLLDSLEHCIEGEVDEASQIIGRVRIEAGAVVKGSRIIGPVLIGAGTEVVDSYLGPSTTIGANCTIRDSEIEFSIVLEDSLFDGIGRVQASMIGRGVQVTRGPRTPSTHRLLIGDHGQVQISG